MISNYYIDVIKIGSKLKLIVLMHILNTAHGVTDIIIINHELCFILPSLCYWLSTQKRRIIDPTYPTDYEIDYGN